MQTRTSFNGGEMSPEMAARADMDAYMRGCRILENWELSQMGGIKRRRGMRYFADASTPEARLFPYVYSYDENADASLYLVEVSASSLRVLDMDGALVKSFNVGFPYQSVKVFQLNALLFLVCSELPPYVLSSEIVEGDDADSVSFSLKQYAISRPAWRYDNERRDYPIRLSMRKTSSGSSIWHVEFDENDDSEDAYPIKNDILRLSYWIEQKEAYASSSSLRANVQIKSQLEACASGTKIAIAKEKGLTYWVCTQEFPADLYKEGLDDPEDYPDNFSKANDLEGYGSVKTVTSVHDVTGGKITEGTKFAMQSGYWEYYTCIKNFTALDMVDGATNYSDYPQFFVRGLAVGSALTCRGKWEFYCSGLWYGSYEIRRNYESNALDSDEWESLGISFSRLGEGSNTQISGDESDQECYLRLFLTRSRWMGNNILSGFPADSCSNRLIVEAYRHDKELKCTNESDSSDGLPRWSQNQKVKPSFSGSRLIYNWSWQAWSERYGYPENVAEFQQRLIFASTAAQPQSVWMSRTDDFPNFSTGDSDDSALSVTLATRSQNPICWLSEKRGALLLGTSEAEFAVSANNRGSITPSNIDISSHGDNGSANASSLSAENNVLYLERGSGRVYEFGYDFQIDGYRSRDLTIFAPHVLADHGGATHATLMRKPDKVAVFVLADGQLALCTYNTMHEVNAWHRWTTNGSIISACAMPDGTRSDRLFLLVSRESGVSIEVVDEDSDYEDNGENDYYSEVYTNALLNPLEAKIDKSPKLPVNVLLGCEIDRKLLELRSFNTAYTGVAREELTLSPGWHKLLTLNSNEYENAVGLRFHGNAPCHILALQG